MVDDSALARTRAALHAVAEQVLAAALHRATGRIGLRVAPGGFGTPEFDDDGTPTRLRVDGTDLVVERGGTEVRTPLTTVRAAAEAAGVAPGAPAEVYTPATPVALDAPLDLDPGAAAFLASFFATVGTALHDLSSRHEADEPAPVQLWPEHFDLATTIAEVNYGGSPGDEGHPLPYLYVGPWAPAPAGDPFWNEPFGASIPFVADTTATAALAFFETGRGRLHP